MARTKLETNKTMDRYVDRLTTFRAGIIGDQDDRHRTEMFIDPSPYCSLAGLGQHAHKTPRERSEMVAKNPRAATGLGEAAMCRTRGKKYTGANPHAQIGPNTLRGAPPISPSRNRWFTSDGKSATHHKGNGHG